LSAHQEVWTRTPDELSSFSQRFDPSEVARPSRRDPAETDDRKIEDGTGSVLAKVWVGASHERRNAAVIPAALDLDLECDLTAPGSARRFVAAALAHEGRSALAPVAVQVVSELVTNAVVHTPCEWLLLRVAAFSRGVRISVFDTDVERVPHLAERPDKADGGMGLHIVDNLTEDWGYSVLDRCKEVWFELRDT
jgi:anti-sigma regulatory factor (Ser/Thr protein kinase)